MNTCKHFNPNTVALSHDGVEENGKFEYDGDFPYHVCMNRKMRTDISLPACGTAHDQSLCAFYEPSEDVVVAQLKNEDDEVTHELVSHLTRQNIRTYTVRSSTGEVAYSETVHGSEDALSQGQLALEMLQEEHGGEIEQVNEETNSYLKKVTVA